MIKLKNKYMTIEISNWSSISIGFSWGKSAWDGIKYFVIDMPFFYIRFSFYNL